MITFIVVTGASRGLGKAIAVSFAKAIKNPLHIVLTGRNNDGLQNTRNEVLSSRSDAICDVVCADLSQLSSLQAVANTIFSLDPSKQYEKAIFINNAGSLGPLAVIGHPDTKLDEFQSVFDFNVTSSSYLTAEFIKKFGDKASSFVMPSTLIINISSLCAVKPFPTWGIYCAGKAARDMFHSVLAEEYKTNTDVKILNYAPGPLDTDMQKEIREGPAVNKDTQEYFKQLFEEGQLISTAMSAEKLMKILEVDSYISGAHVDYFDDITGPVASSSSEPSESGSAV